MNYEYDRDKSALNKDKHGIDFEEAKTLWDDPNALEVELDFVDEDRNMVIGRIKGKHYSAVVTYRGSKCRIISVRRSRKDEVEYYESI